MAAEVLSNISNALSQVFDAELKRQWNRMAVSVSLVRSVPGLGKNAAWDVEFSGATANTVAEGSDVQTSEFNSDVNVPAILSWGHYRSAFQISETELDAAGSSVGVPSALLDLFGERMMGSITKLASKVNNDFLNATGTDGSSNPTLVGLFQGPLETSGQYAGIDRGTYAEWKGNVLSNGSVARPLTLDLMYQLEQSIFTASGVQPSMIITTPAIYRKYAGLFSPNLRVNVEGRPMSYDGAADSLFWKGIPIVRDKDMPSGKMLFLDPSQVEIKYLPRRQSPAAATMQVMTGLVGGNGANIQNATGLPVQFKLLATTGDAVKASAKLTIAALVKRPNACGYISDIQET